MVLGPVFLDPSTRRVKTYNAGIGFVFRLGSTQQCSTAASSITLCPGSPTYGCVFGITNRRLDAYSGLRLDAYSGHLYRHCWRCRKAQWLVLRCRTSVGSHGSSFQQCICIVLLRVMKRIPRRFMLVKIFLSLTIFIGNINNILYLQIIFFMKIYSTIYLIIILIMYHKY
jgi:hypothetical protein